MRTPQQYLTSLLAGIEPLDPAMLPLAEVDGCVLAEDVHAKWALPSFANSSMDGYALRAEDVRAASQDHRIRLEVIADIPAGTWPSTEVTPGTAARIMTGAPVPTGADGIVPVEHTDGGMPFVEVMAPAGHHIRFIGEDIQPGELVLTRDEVMSARTVALAAAVGRAALLVHPNPRVAVISTGSELVEPGQLPEPGQVSDVNGVMLELSLRELGAFVTRSSVIDDDPIRLGHALDTAAERADLIITTGGVSMGAYDTVKELLTRLGTVTFERVAMQPGMPQGFGHVGAHATPIITLPGNPASALVSFEAFVRPVVRRLQGHRDSDFTSGTLIASAEFSSPEGKVQFVRARFDSKDAQAASPIGSQGSHVLGGLAQAECLLIVPAEVAQVHAGDTLAFIDLRRDRR